MKIAVCISGQPRNYKKGYHELKKWFLDKYDCDVYIHTWEETEPIIGSTHPFAISKNYQFTKEDYSKILELYKPKDYEFQLPIPFDGTGVKGEVLGYKLNDLLSAGYSRQACYNLVEDSEIKYDLVIRTRFDLQFTDYISPECLLLKDLSLLDPNKLNTFSYPLDENGVIQRTSEVDDLFAVSSREIARIYADYFSFMLSYIYIDKNYKSWLSDLVSNPDLICAESLLKYHLIKNQVKIEYIPSLTNHFTAHILR